jgi:hypothetical protein
MGLLGPGLSGAWDGSAWVKTLVVEVEFNTDPNEYEFRRAVLDEIQKTARNVLTEADLPGGENAADQLNLVASETSPVEKIRPWLIPRPIGILPQWPLVVTASMLQFPSNWAADTGGAQQMITNAVDRAKAHIRLPVTEPSYVVLLVTRDVLVVGPELQH